MNVLDPLGPLRRFGLSDKLVLTHNTKKTDGMGARLQRNFAIYGISRLLSVSYLHTPLRSRRLPRPARVGSDCRAVGFP